jgi:hypothetical protein
LKNDAAYIAHDEVERLRGIDDMAVLLALHECEIVAALPFGLGKREFAFARL